MTRYLEILLIWRFSDTENLRTRQYFNDFNSARPILQSPATDQRLSMALGAASSPNGLYRKFIPKHFCGRMRRRIVYFHHRSQGFARILSEASSLSSVVGNLSYSAWRFITLPVAFHKTVKKNLAMPLMPLWPNLQPRATDPIWFSADNPCDDESEVSALEAEHETWKEQMRGVGCDQIPIGKSASDFRGSEEEEEEEEEEEGEGEEEEESDTHEEEEEEFDDIDMEVSYTHQQQRSSPTDTVTDPVSIRMVSAHAPRYS